MSTVPSVSLQTAVLMQVKEFAAANNVFSVHDITTALRRKTSKGELEIPEVEVAGASFRFDIPHAKVKAIWDEAWRTGLFDPSYTLTRNFNGTFFEYTPKPVVAAPVVSAVPSPTTVFVNTSGNTLIPMNVPTATTPSPTTNGNVDISVITKRVETYLKNCADRNFRPTLKQVQSAVKREASTGYSCQQFQNIVEGLGYTVVSDPDSIAHSQVATV